MSKIENQDLFDFGRKEAVARCQAILQALFGHAAINEHCAKARRLTGTNFAVFYGLMDGELILIGADGLSALEMAGLVAPPKELMRRGIAPVEYMDMMVMPHFAKESLVHQRPGWRYAVNVPVSCGFEPDFDMFTGLVCLDVEPRSGTSPNLPVLQSLALTMSELVTRLFKERAQLFQPVILPPVETAFMLNDSSRDYSADPPDHHKEQPAESLIPQPDHSVALFLNETLIRRQRLRSRKSIHYLALRSWAKPIKNYQINALRALKVAAPAQMVDDLAAEMANAIRSVHGIHAGAQIVPVPCGHSGAGCLSSLLAHALARQLNLECVEAFLCQARSGSSHPKTNLRRPKMKLVREVTAPVILVDDVATSGAHIEEAARLLSLTAPVVLPIVWIAD